MQYNFENRVGRARFVGWVAAIAVLGGCLSGSHPPATHDFAKGITLSRAGCAAAGGTHSVPPCVRGPAGWVVANITLVADDASGVGVSGDLCDDLVLRNVTFKSFGRGVQIHVMCDCRVTLENVRVEGPWMDGSCHQEVPCFGQTGILVRAPAAAMVLARHVSVEGYTTAFELHGWVTEASGTQPGQELPSPELRVRDASVACLGTGF